MMIVFPDTHLFLHFRDLRELSWDRAISDDAIAIMVGRTVQKELEKKKYELRGRPQDRARTYASKLAEIVNTSTPLVVRNQSPRVTLDFVSRPSGWTPPNDLDASWQDDQIVADVLAFAASHPDDGVAILTGDAGLTATARAHHIQVIKPDADWEMPSETSPEEKEIKKLKQEISQLQKRGPSISVELRRDGNEPIRHIELPFDWYTPLPEAEIAALLDEIKTKHPLATTFNRLPNGEIASEQSCVLPNQEAIETYQSEYAQWGRDVISFTRRIARGSARADILSKFEIWLRNVGVEPANRMRFAMDVTDCLSLWSDDSADREKIVDKPKPKAVKDEILTAQPFRRPPSAPGPRRLRPPLPDINSLYSHGRIDAGMMASIAHQEKLLRTVGRIVPKDVSGMLRSMDALGITAGQAKAVASPVFDLPSIASLRPEPRDPRAFYWRTRSADQEGATEWEYECEEYAHLGDAEVFAFVLSAQMTEGRRHDGVLRVRASANNLRNPIEVTFQVKIVCNQADTMARLRSLLPL